MMLERNEKVLVCVGVNKLRSSTSRYPVPFSDVAMMIRECLNNPPHLFICPQQDNPEDNEEWSSRFDHTIDNHLNLGQRALLYGSRDSFIPKYRGKHETLEIKSEAEISATMIRASIQGYLPEASAHRNYIRGLIARGNFQHPLHPTAVDIAVWDKDKDRLLLCRKHGQNDYRFIGGFCDGKTCYEEDGQRECLEEVALSVKNPKLLSSYVVNDPRYTFEAESIISVLLVAEYDGGTNKALDDIEESRWFSLNAFEWAEGEAPILEKYNLSHIRPLHRGMLEEVLDEIKRRKSLETTTTE
jgi:ADP-ribose pyrophosphatase YjhB (NUDIX family)